MMTHKDLWKVVFALLLFVPTVSHGLTRWEDTEELFSACSQDPTRWCKNRLVHLCGQPTSQSSLECARRNAKALFNEQWRRNICDGVPCSDVGGGDNHCQEAKNKFKCK
jgi:hypothetical protein